MKILGRICSAEWMGGWLDGDYERMWKEVVMAQLWLYYGTCLEDVNETRIYHSQDISCPAEFWTKQLQNGSQDHYQHANTFGVIYTFLMLSHSD
jgi:hypothetical protein